MSLEPVPSVSSLDPKSEAMQRDLDDMLRVADVRWGIFFRGFNTLEWVYWILIITSTVSSAAATLLPDQGSARGWARVCSGISAVLIAILGVTQLQTRATRTRMAWRMLDRTMRFARQRSKPLEERLLRLEQALDQVELLFISDIEQPQHKPE